MPVSVSGCHEAIVFPVKGSRRWNRSGQVVGVLELVRTFVRVGGRVLCLILSREVLNGSCQGLNPSILGLVGGGEDNDL